VFYLPVESDDAPTHRINTELQIALDTFDVPYTRLGENPRDWLTEALEVMEKNVDQDQEAEASPE
jgi:hypothetical protein